MASKRQTAKYKQIKGGCFAKYFDALLFNKQPAPYDRTHSNSIRLRSGRKEDSNQLLHQTSLVKLEKGF